MERRLGRERMADVLKTFIAEYRGKRATGRISPMRSAATTRSGCGSG